MMMITLRVPGLCLCGCLLVVGCAKPSQEKEASRKGETVAVTLAPSRILSVDRTVDIVGTLYGDEEATISAKVAGRVEKTLADVGDRVEANAALAQIDPVDYELARKQSETLLQQTLSKLGLSHMPDSDFNPDTVPTVQQAKLQAANAEARFRRSEKLFRQDPPLISEQDYADAKTAAEVAKSTYDVALLAAKSLIAEANTRLADLAVMDRKLADTVVRAPRSDARRQYAVVARLVSGGEYLKDGTAMFRVVADNPIRFRATVPERYLADVAPNQKVSVLVESFKTPFIGSLRRINPQIDRDSRSFQVEIDLENAKGLLRPGAFARGQITTHSDPNTLFVPEAALVTFAGIRKVYTVENGKAAEHEVTIGVRQDDLVEIVSGLKGSPAVAVSGISKLSNGTPVQVAGQPTPATGPKR